MRTCSANKAGRSRLGRRPRAPCFHAGSVRASETESCHLTCRCRHTCRLRLLARALACAGGGAPFVEAATLGNLASAPPLAPAARAVARGARRHGGAGRTKRCASCRSDRSRRSIAADSSTREPGAPGCKVGPAHVHRILWRGALGICGGQATAGGSGVRLPVAAAIAPLRAALAAGLTTGEGVAVDRRGIDGKEQPPRHR